LAPLARPMEVLRSSQPEPASAPAPFARLEVVGVSKCWPGQKPVLEDLALRVEAGELCWISGRNGTGKTTLLRVIAGLIEADSGSVAIDGCTWTQGRESYQRRVGFLAAGNTGLYARLSVQQQLQFCAQIAYVRRTAVAASVENGLTWFGLHPLAAQRVDHLSLGQRQRVRLAMAFLHEPELVLLDEPATSLDDEGLGQLQSVIAASIARGSSVIWCAPAGQRLGLPIETDYRLLGGRLTPG
jgi:ABC-2 type transport system ATP-binding protein